jgi:thioredoxin-related protein
MHRLFVIVALFSAVALSAAESAVDFTPVTSWQQALDRAKEEKKYLFVDAYTDWCGWCKVMDKNTFTNDEVGDRMNEKFVSVKIEMETDWGIDVAMKYGVRGFPTFLVFSPEGVLVQRIVGYQPPEQFLVSLHNALDPVTQTPEPGRRVGSTPTWPVFLRNAFLKGKARKMPDSTTVHLWLEAQKDWTTEEAWAVIATCESPTADQWVVKERKKLAGLYGQEAVDGRLNRMVYAVLEQATSTSNEATFQHAIGMLHEFSDAGKDISGDSVAWRLNFYKGSKQWSKLGSTLYDGVTRYNIPLSYANQFAWEVYEQSDDQGALRDATKAMAYAVDHGKPGYAELDTYAALLYKTHQLVDAEVVAKKAITEGQAKQEDVEATKELLKKIQAELHR